MSVGALLLQDEARGRAIIAVGKSDIVHIELELGELIITEAEDRHTRELAISHMQILVARAFDPQIVVVLEPLGVRKEHDADLERTEAELTRGLHDHASTANGTAPVKDAELTVDHEEVEVLLLVAELLEYDILGDALTQVLRAELALDAVEELLAVGHPELVEDNLHRLVVRESNLLPAREDEFALGALRHRCVSERLVGVADVREEFTQPVRLFGDQTRLAVPRKVPAARLDLFVGEILQGREPGKHRQEVLLKQLLKYHFVIDNPQSLIIAQCNLVERLPEDELHDLLDQILLIRRDLPAHRPPLVEAACPRCSEPTTNLAHETSILPGFRKALQNTGLLKPLNINDVPKK